MKVSVIIPHYNAEVFLPDAIESVLAQGEHVREIIVVDDGSDEERWEKAMYDSALVLKRLAPDTLDETWWRYAENRGQGAVLNAGVNMAKGDLVAFLDADDVWARGKLEQQVSYLKEHSVAGTYGNAYQFQHRPYLISDVETKLRVSGIDGEAIKAAPLMSGLCVRREVLGKYPFGEGIGAGMTIEWFARVSDAGLDLIRQPLLFFYRRVHGDNYGIRRHKEAVFEYANGIRMIEERRKREREANAKST